MYLNACRTKATDHHDYSERGVLPLCKPYGLAELLPADTTTLRRPFLLYHSFFMFWFESYQNTESNFFQLEFVIGVNFIGTLER